MTPPARLPRSLNRFDAAMMIMGNMIGIGIFTTTGFNAQHLHSPAGLFLVWILGGIYAFCGALTYAELSSRFPRAGGDYLFLKHAYHPLAGFLFGWSTFTVTYSGSIATIAIGFAAYFVRILPGDLPQMTWRIPLLGAELSLLKPVALLVAFLLTLLNSRGIRKGAGFQNATTVLGIITLLAIIVAGFLSGRGNPAHFRPFLPDHFSPGEISMLGVALVGVLFTYSGWTVLVYIAEEIKNPRKNIPAAMGMAVGLVAALYILMNAVYLYAQPLREMPGTVEIGYRTLAILFGKNTSLLFSLIIMLMVLSSLNATILSGSRVYFAMAREGLFFNPAGRLHPRYRAPANSLWLQFCWATVLILAGTFDQLLTYTVFVMVLFSFLSGIALFILRRRAVREGEPATVYHAWGYPVIALIYLGISAWLMGNTLYHQPLGALAGVLIVLSGTPFYFYWKKNSPLY
ncbi:MAG: amino acid permease [Calditrichia bacterium]|nr:amino acid permease [Calditrichia bacterium]